MESLVSLKCSEPGACNSPLPTAPIWQDVLAQAVTGELMAAMNYHALSTICDNPKKLPMPWSTPRENRDTPKRSLPKVGRSE